ncbi:hypothetical protein GLOIN_2v1770644 [Rhizophagus irregularis DAOM 181602=DAOM 197198]|uniref:Uncharacterized protein n=1 Tax=Rhizophagus irregularis (strain DAOM 181602 / DAOM 197198 / MUCL 43194) TaxID=747089 RepID=A0A2P4QBN3_RHIID|nr:hypothetical protein GLOIN_2v1770644 [Rhizophagus irregularis DAOM 181602=DAOM 197198]POG75044.1 hypothetical protein GLOIN_2v1770644 [Rhizophagus irregularis DAOM 181602=DAOM 197198]|eukprot:XP_025181910.1 hypothetical protein GLOIN_2v1770644 [Rhizophagus irregularis DAOM 181602=DAOM 197198]
MLYLIVTVTKNVKCFGKQSYSELYKTFTSGQFNNKGAKVYVHQNKTDKWVEVSDGLNSDLKIMKVLEYNYVNFSLLIESMRDINPPSFPDAFDIMIRNTQQLKLSQHCIHQTLEKEFVTHVANALWYIDPYLKLLQSRSCHMPSFFKELAIYASDNTDRNTYNLAYYTSHHKKESISHQKLNLLIESLELSIGQSWVNNSEWNNTIPAIISLIEIM